MILKGPLSLACSDTYIDVCQQFRWVIGQITGILGERKSPNPLTNTDKTMH